LSAAAKADLISADLIIVSRKTSSGSYDGEIEFWNGLETPILLQSAYLSRESIWRWLQGDQHDADALTHIAVVDESNLIFNGVTITGGQVEIFPSAIDNTDVSTQDSAGNGMLIATPAGSTDVMIASWDPGIEYYPGSGQIAGGPRIAFLMLRPYQYFPTLTDDGKKMLENAVLMLLGILAGEPKATEPSPADEQTDASRDAILAWTPGESINMHDVYFSTDFNYVNDAGRTNTLDVLLRQDQVANIYDPPGRLDFGQTYYWRIDEIAPDSAIYKGDVWSFTVEPFGYPIAGENIIVTASSFEEDKSPENTVNGSGLVDNVHSTVLTDMWLTATGEPSPAWIQYDFDKAYKLHEMLVWNYNGQSFLTAVGLKDVVVEYSSDGANWVQIDSVNEFARASGLDDYAPNTTIPFDGIPVKSVKIYANSNWSGGFSDQFGLSEVQFLYIPERAREPYPDMDAY